MHAKHLVDLAAVLTTQAGSLLARTQPWPPKDLSRYRQVARTRLQKWSREIAVASDRLSHADNLDQTRDLSAASEPLVCEILVSEPLTRVWSAILEQSQQNRSAAGTGTAGEEPVMVARDVYREHLNVRRSALDLMIASGAFEKVEQLTRHCDRWSDLLLSEILPVAPLAEHFAVELKNVRLMACPQEHRDGDALVMAASQAFAECPHPAAHPDLNQQLAGAVSACLELPSAEPQSESGADWTRRMETAAEDSGSWLLEAMIERTTLSARLPRRRN